MIDPTAQTDPAARITPADQRTRLDALEAAVRARSALVPEVGIILGSGLGALADDLEDAVAIPFAELPGWPPATAPGHVGRLLLGRLGGRPVVMLHEEVLAVGLEAGPRLARVIRRFVTDLNS